MAHKRIRGRNTRGGLASVDEDHGAQGNSDLKTEADLEAEGLRGH